jgi:sigma-B regulation protein RsbU (phosphoserine phosphatase)
MALGVLEDATWTEATVEIGRGDALLLYTDGIPDAQSPAQVFFGMPRLLEVLEGQRGRSAPEIQEALLAAVRAFVGEEPQFDDITLMAVSRDLKRPAPRVDLRRVV